MPYVRYALYNCIVGSTTAQYGKCMLHVAVAAQCECFSVLTPGAGSAWCLVARFIHLQGGRRALLVRLLLVLLVGPCLRYNVPAFIRAIPRFLPAWHKLSVDRPTQCAVEASLVSACRNVQKHSQNKCHCHPATPMPMYICPHNSQMRAHLFPLNPLQKATGVHTHASAGVFTAMCLPAGEGLLLLAELPPPSV